MNEVISKMISHLKTNRWSKLAIEEELGFANGTLWKVERGVINLTPEKEKKFHEFYARHGAVQTFIETDVEDPEVSRLNGELADLLAEKEKWEATLQSVEELAKLKELGGQIKSLQAEVQPKHITTDMGKRVWQMDQAKKVKTITDQIVYQLTK